MTRLSDLNTELDRLAPDLADATEVQTLIDQGHRLRAEAMAGMTSRGFAAIGRALRGSPLVRARRRRQTIKQLHSLSDRMLEDIGLRRDQIAEIATLLAARPVTSPVASAPHRATSAVKTMIAKARSARLRRATIRELEQLPDRVLADIGISRGQIPTAVDNILEKRSARAPASQSSASPVHALLSRLENAARPLRQWHVSRLAAGQIARLGGATLADLGYVKGDVDWVPEVMAKRKIANPANRAQAGAA